MRIFLIVATTLSVCLLGASAQSLVTIQEKGIRAFQRDNATVVALPVHSLVEQPVGAMLTLEWMGPKHGVSQAASSAVEIRKGDNLFEIPLPLPAGSIWMRLRYALTAQIQDARRFGPQSGILPIARVAPYAFELKVTRAGLSKPGVPLRIHAQAVHPLTRLPVEVTEWKAELAAGKKTLAPQKVEKRAGGFVEFTFAVPKVEDERGKVWITAGQGDFQQTAVLSLDLEAHPSASIQTDKPVYQPGQTLHFRAIIRDRLGHAAPGETVSLLITNGENDRVHTADLVSSRFGIVHEDWTLPESAAPGSYSLRLVPGEDRDFRLAQHWVRVSRYDLPKFEVIVQPDRTAYAPGQKPRVTVSGRFLFGKPVPKGHVRIVRGAPDGWNRLDPEQEAEAEGEAGEDGRFTTEIDVSEDLESLQQQQWSRFRDVHFVAYYTDPASHRTEPRRFDLRLTLEPIHIYTITGPAGLTYVTTSYADGRPAVTTVQVALEGRTYTLRTNKYGVGRIVLPEPSAGNHGLELRATDATGVAALYTANYEFEESTCRVRTARSLLQPGEGVEIEVLGPKSYTGNVLLQAVADEREVATRVVPLSAGVGRVIFPYQSEFRGVVMFAAWVPGYEDGHGSQVAVIFPEGADLLLAVQPGRPVYRPGEQASLRIHAQTRDGRPAQAAVGLAVVDEAVLQRARTDSDFGQRRWFSCLFCAESRSSIAGISMAELLRVKPEQARDPELNLVAEAMLAGSTFDRDSDSSEELTAVPEFESIETMRVEVRKALDRFYQSSFDFPMDEEALARVLGSSWPDRRDPWNLPFRPQFSFVRNNYDLRIVSAGPDQQYDTDDDFTAGHFSRSYFLPLHRMLEGILRGNRDYPPDVEGLKSLLRDHGLLLDTLKDPWGTPYQAMVEASQRRRSITLTSAGPDRIFRSADDFQADHFEGSYFGREEDAMRRALARVAPPRNREEFESALRASGLDLARYTDAWGHPYRLVSRDSSRYEDRGITRTVQVYGEAPEFSTHYTPVTRKYIVFSLRSDGADGKAGNSDDFDMVSFPFLVKEEAAEAATAPAPMPERPGEPRGRGEIAGLILDSGGGTIANAHVSLSTAGGTVFTTESDSKGAYSFPAVPTGVYELRAFAAGFASYYLRKVPVTGGKVTQCDMVLQVGAVAETVTVAAEAAVLMTESSMSAGVVAAAPLSTPRVRDYFPETLLWLPELTTDAQGRATTVFPLAGSITTWKVAAIASTLDGRQVESESSLRAFQPFFLDFDPPATLTQGDRIEMPVMVRNYLDQAQQVEVTLQPNAWSTVEQGVRRQVRVAANSSETVTFAVLAKSAADKAAQRLAAEAGREKDLIEKTSVVHPDGQFVTQTVGDLVAGTAAFQVSLPPAAIPGVTTSELRLYPNIFSILAEGAAGLLVKPHGCAEQTTSAGYANLIALRFARAAGVATPAFEASALKNIQLTLDQLPAFAGSGGGLSYWGSGAGDVAVTAYALDFLLAVRPIVAPGEQLSQRLAHWLESQQNPAGLWGSLTTAGSSGRADSILTTAQAARSLAAARHAGLTVKPEVLSGAFHYLAQFADSTDEPYLLAQFILAALDAGQEPLVTGSAARLISLAHPEGTASYWALRSNSPFYGWGTAGRLETTGLVISALAAWRAGHPQTPGLDAALRNGLQFLLRHRDSDGSWSSTQSTVRAMRAVVDAAQALGSLLSPGGALDVRINGHVVRRVSLPAEVRSSEPVSVDLAPFLQSGGNRVEVTPTAGTGNALVRMTTAHWLPWPAAQRRSATGLRFAVSFGTPAARIGAAVRCSVQAERVGFVGYGMMIAQVGLPPGTELDRQSLEDLLDSGLGIDHYEIRPDRVVFYLWPKAGGSSFDFGLSLRLPMTAKSGPSVLYDYYNPEALTEVPPVTFTVR